MGYQVLDDLKAMITKSTVTFADDISSLLVAEVICLFTPSCLPDPTLKVCFMERQLTCTKGCAAQSLRGSLVKPGPSSLQSTNVQELGFTTIGIL